MDNFVTALIETFASQKWTLLDYHSGPVTDECLRNALNQEISRNNFMAFWCVLDTNKWIVYHVNGVPHEKEIAEEVSKTMQTLFNITPKIQYNILSLDAICDAFQECCTIHNYSVYSIRTNEHITNIKLKMAILNADASIDDTLTKQNFISIFYDVLEQFDWVITDLETGEETREDAFMTKMISCV